ncbi:(p)ppGpp synthetase [Lactonifactor longoviformis]|uniref:Putative GTP pyrophosphokinase n=1 Tax=Lactonifactor longoviformis DSM 17459 TaxID=1122155 RepID=A0A1M4YA97_9CLOT|nr:(p)ppGpp synthetase [Lactonifactor longoviformis]POP32421.1 (p)ppGpp synthetase [Lactonifactor longoviformis]SHF02558.1 putative GTP pyrophosphokinase [Lactonifactor longoviformis DSM 17459]
MTIEQYNDLVQPYMDASQILMSRLEALNHNLEEKYQNCPIHYIQHRIKKKESIEGKLKRLKLKSKPEDAKENLQDIAGIRVICYFEEDIYHLVVTIKKQGDLVLIKERDYVREPKPNGYRSYHLVLGVPVYYEDGMAYFPVEIQLRTMSMDFWASMEHRICYKRTCEDKEKMAGEFLSYARMLQEIEKKFEDSTGDRSI